MADFSTDLQQPLAWFHRPTMDPTPKYHRQHHQESYFADDCEDRLSASEPPQPAPVSPYDKDSMFEKSLTPSDVGKLNRLVIPKQHAEKYFPLGGDVAGTLLGFEDEAGKCWRFRYSYWNSSQSYVLTKGWSRYVKEKRLDAGDVVFFERHRSDPERLFIGWRRRGAAPPQPAVHYNAQGYPMAQDSRRQALGLSQYQTDCSHSGGVQDKLGEQKGTPGSSSSNGNPKRLVRLFGVNLECQLEDSSSQTTSSEGSSSLSSQHQQYQQQQRQAYNAYFNYMGYPTPPNHHHHYQMDMNFTQGVNQMGNRLG